MGPIARVRRTLATTLRSRVAGEDADAMAHRIWGSDEPRWFTPDDPIWRVHADASMFVGGIRALLLQSLQPQAMAGVTGHSGYRSDPWGRLNRTSNFIALTTFGPIHEAEAVIEHVNDIHSRVRGKDDRGVPYRANDPHLLEWVHVAEAASFLECYQRFGPQRLSDVEADRYVAQTSVVAGLLGVQDPPMSVAALHARLEDYRPELRATDGARDAAAFLLHEPPLPPPALPGYGMLAGGALGTLPGWVREELGIRHHKALDATVLRPMGHAAAAIVRWAMSDPAIASERRSHR